MSAIRCEECPYSCSDGESLYGGALCCHTDNGSDGHERMAEAVVVASDTKPSDTKPSNRPLWCPRRRDAAKRCRTCGERLVRWAEKGDALIEMYCPRCAP